MKESLGVPSDFTKRAITNGVRSAIGLFTIVLTVAGCRTTGARNAETARQIATKPAQSIPDQWLGQWDGPEGTSLRLSRTGEKYVVVIQNLDGPPGTAKHLE